VSQTITVSVTEQSLGAKFTVDGTDVQNGAEVEINKTLKITAADVNGLTVDAGSSVNTVTTDNVNGSDVALATAGAMSITLSAPGYGDATISFTVVKKENPTTVANGDYQVGAVLSNIPDNDMTYAIGTDAPQVAGAATKTIGDTLDAGAYTVTMGETAEYKSKVLNFTINKIDQTNSLSAASEIYGTNGITLTLTKDTKYTIDGGDEQTATGNADNVSTGLAVGQHTIVVKGNTNYKDQELTLEITGKVRTSTIATPSVDDTSVTLNILDADKELTLDQLKGLTVTVTRGTLDPITYTGVYRTGSATAASVVYDIVDGNGASVKLAADDVITVSNVPKTTTYAAGEFTKVTVTVP
jgi:hypothetical protein